jgi:large subunit ribosomal protein L23
MSAFWKKEEDKKVKGDKTAKKSVGASKAEKKGSKKKVSSKKNKELVVPGEKADLINRVLIKPMISEAVMNAQEFGKYTFKVRKTATKNEIALAIEALYKVSVKKVNVMNYKSTSRFFRGKNGSVKGYKKAVITLIEGDKIKLFS